MLDFIRNLLKSEPARITAYLAGVVLAGVVYLAGRLNWELSVEFQGAVTFIAVAVIGELIRRFVYAPDTVQAIANQATYQTAGSTVDIGKPPDASPPLPPETPNGE